MMVACVLNTITSSAARDNSSCRRRLVLKEMDITTGQLKGRLIEAENDVGADKGDVILCSAGRNKYIAVGIIDRIRLVGANVYSRGAEMVMPDEVLHSQ